MSSANPKQQTAKVPPPTQESKESSDEERKRRDTVQLFPNPIAYIDLLCAREVVGNTPRPSKVKDLFFQGMRILDKRPGKATDFLQQAVKLANEELKAQTSSQVPKIDIERMAYSLMGLGYCQITQGELDKAANYYKRSVTYWASLHKTTLQRVIPIMIDLIILLILVNRAKEVNDVTVKLVAITKKTKTEEAPWINAYSYSRLASVASGQKGNASRLPLAEGQKKAHLPPKLISYLYMLSVDYMKKNAKSDKEEQVAALSEVQNLQSQFLQRYKGKLTTPKSKNKTPKSKTSPSIATTTTTSTTTPSTETEKSETETSAPKATPENTQEKEAPEKKVD